MRMDRLAAVRAARPSIELLSNILIISVIYLFESYGLVVEVCLRLIGKQKRLLFFHLDESIYE